MNFKPVNRRARARGLGRTAESERSAANENGAGQRGPREDPQPYRENFSERKSMRGGHDCFYPLPLEDLYDEILFCSCYAVVLEPQWPQSFATQTKQEERTVRPGITV